MGETKRQNTQTGEIMPPNWSKELWLPKIQAFLEMWVCLVYWLSLVGFTWMVLFKEEDGLADSEEGKCAQESWLLI